jgi:hypothetical protein
MKLPLDVSAPVDTPIERVAAAIDSDWLLKSWLDGSVDPSTVHVQRTPGRVAIEGDWWYRGELTAESTHAGARLHLRVSNVAKRSRWAVPLANMFFRGFPEQQQETVTRLAREIEQRQPS